jgi:hypothetical protein
MHFTQDEENGVTLTYADLDPTANYKVRFTLVRPWYQERYADRMNQHSESIFADDELIAKDLELPLQMSDFFTYDIPRKVTEDGKLTIWFQKADDVAMWSNGGILVVGAPLFRRYG